MRRSYRSAKFLDILRKIREAMPDAQISTDIIVGFPGETEEDFQETLRVVEEARFASAFTFIYSPVPARRRLRWSRFRMTWCRTDSNVLWRCRNTSPKNSRLSKAVTSR